MFSVIIPNYNNAHFLRQALSSVLGQTCSDYEIIVIDDGSTDNSKRVVDDFGDKVRYIWQENRGLGGARNTGILASNAEYVALLDADDEWGPVFLERMMSLIQKYPDAAVYYCGARAVDGTGRYLPQIFGRGLSSNDIYESLLRANFIIPSTVILRRSVILTAGLFEEKNRELHGCEDWDLWLRLAPNHAFVGTPEPLVKYRLHNNTFSSDTRHMQNAVKGVVEKNFGLDDGQYHIWSPEKRRAFGGVYRYQVIKQIQSQDGWDSSEKLLCKALQADPSLAVDLGFFYELALGTQPAGYRDQAVLTGFERNAAHLKQLVRITCGRTEIKPLRRLVLGTCYFALGLVAYNSGERSRSRNFLVRALAHRPGLIFDSRVSGNIVKSFLGRDTLRKLKKLIGATP